MSCCLVLLYREILKENSTLIGIGVQSKVPSICSQRALIHSARLFCFLPIALFIPILFSFFFPFCHLFPPLDGDTGVPARVFGWGIGRWKAWRRKGGDVKRKKAKEKSKKKKARASVHERPTRSGGLSFLPVGRSKVCSISISLLIKFRMQKLHNVNCFCCNTLDNEKWQLLTCLQSDLNGVDNIREH